MNKPIPFPSKESYTNAEEFLKDFLSKICAREYEIDNLAISFLNKKDNTVMTRYYQCNAIDKQNLASNIQIDAMWDIVKTNIGL